MLELCLIIAMKHLITLSEGDSFNFEMVYQGILESSLALSLPIMLWEIFPPPSHFFLQTQFLSIKNYV